MNHDWPCLVNESYLIRPHDAQPPCRLKGAPQPGKGDRSLFCDQYDRCLDFAAGQEWESFNCQSCTYEKKGQISFHFSSFQDIEDEIEEDICFCSEALIDRMVLNRQNQEDLLIMIIDGGLLDGQ